MKTFESEFTALTNWIRQKNDEYIENKKKEIGKPIIKGHDSELTYRYLQDVQKYSRRLAALKKKYGIETTAQEITSNQKTTRARI